jgi:isoquinoline 1-oxidoreductase subunit alpha
VRASLSAILLSDLSSKRSAVSTGVIYDAGLTAILPPESGEFMRVTINGRVRDYVGDAEMPLLWYLRDDVGLKGAKFGCGRGICGACTVHIDGDASASCVTPMSAVANARVTTIEGLAVDDTLHAVQQAWIDEDVAQCGYCQAGQIMAVVDLLKRIPKPTDADIDSNLTNLCRCGTYYRLRKAIHRAAAMSRKGSAK